MKKIFLIAFLVSLAAFSQAQNGANLPLAAGDTITNTGTSSKVITLTGGYSGAAVQVILTKLSGTGAGTVQLQGCNDGTNYVNLGSAFTITNVTTQSTMFYVTAPVPKYLKVLATGSGTESVVQTVNWVGRKYQTF
jgi:hypothetical protein